MNENDCGVFACTSVEYIGRGTDTSSTQEDVPTSDARWCMRIYLQAPHVISTC